MREEYIQIGITALRDPATKDFLPAVPLYIKATEETTRSMQKLEKDIGKIFAQKMKRYQERNSDGNGVEENHSS